VAKRRRPLLCMERLRRPKSKALSSRSEKDMVLLFFSVFPLMRIEGTVFYCYSSFCCPLRQRHESNPIMPDKPRKQKRQPATQYPRGRDWIPVGASARSRCCFLSGFWSGKVVLRVVLPAQGPHDFDFWLRAFLSWRPVPLFFFFFGGLLTHR
jgi:hypothetical protein